MAQRGLMGDTYTRVGNRNTLILESKYCHFKGMVNHYGKPMFKSEFALMRHVCRLVTPRPLDYVPPVPIEIGYRRSYDPQRLEMANAIGAQILLSRGTGAPTANEVLRSLGYYEQFIEKDHE